jgi:hypothetical protein
MSTQSHGHGTLFPAQRFGGGAQSSRKDRPRLPQFACNLTENTVGG